ncbi:MAG: hydroxymethylglutaryl-CoA lyase [Niastella sp.]|nr:hydroxymethylglutaryl-CoA lyase [Niastella sp.]
MPTGKKDFQFVECPRDAMQGWPHFIPTQMKIEYLQALLKVGFHTLDCGSFVSPKAIPQMADTKEVLSKLDLKDSNTKLLAIIANLRGAIDAVSFDMLSYLGFPFSVSETFQMRNTNSSMNESLVRVAEIQNLCVQKNKSLVIYLSMGFGNPYGDPYSEEIVFSWAEKMAEMEIKIISVADTVGLAHADQINRVISYLIKELPAVQVGVHLHSAPMHWKQKIEAAWQAGCQRYDGAMKGIGGCPMADDVLVGNMDTERMIPFFKEKEQMNQINETALANCSAMAASIFI